MQDPLVVGAVGAPHGVRGWVRIRSFTAPESNILDYPDWYLRHGDGPWQPVERAEARRHHGSVLVRFAGVDDRDAAAALTRADIAVPAAALPALPAGEHYWKDLIGLPARTPSGVALGRVERLLETGANDVLCLRAADGRERLVPWISSVVLAVGTDGIVLDWDPEF